MLNPMSSRVRSVWMASAVLLAAAGCGEAPKPVPKPELKPADVPATPQEPVKERGDGSYPGFRVAAFRVKIRRPGAGGVTEETFDSRATKLPTLYIMNSAGCPACTEYADRMKAFETKYMPKGVDVVHVYPNRGETDAEKIAWHKDNGFTGGQILENARDIALKLETAVTPTVYLADASGRIVYRGGIDDSMYPGRDMKTWLADAMDAFLAGKPIAEDTTEPSG